MEMCVHRHTHTYTFMHTHACAHTHTPFFSLSLRILSLPTTDFGMFKGICQLNNQNHFGTGNPASVSVDPWNLLLAPLNSVIVPTFWIKMVLIRCDTCLAIHFDHKTILA